MEEWAERKLPVFSYPFFMSFVRVRSAREDNMKKAILTVSFGTSHLDTLEKTIGAIERELAEAFPDRTLYRAFTSGISRTVLAGADRGSAFGSDKGL